MDFVRKKRPRSSPKQRQSPRPLDQPAPYVTESSKIRGSIIGLLEGKSVLDIGCGIEKVVPWALGVDDLSESSRGADLNANVAPGGDLLASLRGLTYDVVFSSHTLEHIPSPIEETLLLWAQAVAPGGRLILYLPDEAHYQFDPRNPRIKNPAHAHLLTFETFIPVMARLPGFVIEEARMDLGPGRYSFLVVAKRRDA